MALQASVIVEDNVTLDYWKIIEQWYDGICKITNVSLVGYVSEEDKNVSDSSWKHKFYYQFAGPLSVSESYAKIKESVIGISEVTPAITEGVLPDITVIQPSVTEEVETNIFYGATDI